MVNLSTKEKEKLIEMIKKDQTIPSIYKSILFKDGDNEYIEATKDYKLVYKNKARKEDVIANTPAAPLQKIRTFNSNNKFKDGWNNMLIYGDNLMALKTIYKDQRNENKLKTKNKIKLIYIDPPFATKQDFMKDREKAYRDKIIGSKFIEFLRKRLILLREILADDGTIFVHLDWKKGHYIKAIMDEIFGEHNFLNEIIWCYAGGGISLKDLPRKHDTIFRYSKGGDYYFDPPLRNYSPTGSGRRSDGSKYDLNATTPHNDWWVDIAPENTQSRTNTNYPTQKPEKLLERIIKSSTKKDSIILDAFAGSGTTLSVAEKLDRKWIGIDSSKLSIYTIQKRLLNLYNIIGTTSKDDRREHERVNDFKDHSKSYSRGLLMVYKKARKGELVIDDELLKSFAKFLEKNIRTKTKQKFSICCPKDKFQIKKLKIKDDIEDVYKAGVRAIEIDNIIFLISFIEEKTKPKKEKEIKAKEFNLYNAGVYDFEKIKDLDWKGYRKFVLQLFEVREKKDKIYGFEIDGYIGTYPVYIWNYPDKKEQIIDKEYIRSIHESIEGRAGDKFYIIAPIMSLEFMEDEVKIDDTTYVMLKVPESILLKLLEQGEKGAIKQPISEDNVNEIINAVGYDFISQPLVEYSCLKGNPSDLDLFNKDNKDYLIKLDKFKSKTLTSDPEEFFNFETLSMIMVDLSFNGEYFELDKTFWADDLINKELERQGKNKNISYEEKLKLIEFLTVRIEEEDFNNDKIMVILLDKYGNEKKILLDRSDF